MRASIIVPVTLFAASVIAHPHGAGHPHKSKRETHQYMQDGHVVVEEIVVKTITVPAGGMPTSSVAPAQNKVVQHQYHGHRTSSHVKAPAPSSSSSVYVPPPAPEPSSTPEEVQTPAPQTTEDAPAPSQTQAETSPTEGGGGNPESTGPVPGPNNIDTKGSEAWATAPNSMGKSILGTLNYWRTRWAPSTVDFEWDSQLATNARLTAVNDEGGANEMKHHLYDGSMAQCINEGDGESMNGDLTPWENALLGWLCEKPNDKIPCDQIGEAGHYASTGHADIIGGSVTKVGCYYMDSTESHPNFKGMWTCDFS